MALARRAALALLTLALAVSLLPAQSSLDRLGVTVASRSRAYSYTNKESAFLYGETNGKNTTSWQGFNVFGHEFLDDYTLTVDGVELDRTKATATVYPDFLRRAYPGGIIEDLRPVDSLASFSVVVRLPRPGEIILRPWFTDARSGNDYLIAFGPASALLARRSHHVRTAAENFPVWIAIVAPGCSPMLSDMSSRDAVSPLLFASERIRTAAFTFAVADDSLGAWRDARVVSRSIVDQSFKRRGRMERLLARTATTTANPKFDRAIAWAKISMDALIMNQTGRGIFAGLPWFDNYWGRDTFIALAGATLVNGEFTDAKTVIRSFADFQQRDSSSTDYGRVPNIVTTTDKAYNTADGTPRLIMMIREYAERSGDFRFLMEMYPIVIRAIEGTLRYHCDAEGFLTHADAETWMDAVGTEGPWSPRGNRANDIQALWARQLEAGIWCASRFGDVGSARRWDSTLTRLRSNFAQEFIVSGEIADHLRPDGSRDTSLRPNQIFLAPLLSRDQRASVARRVATRLTYPWGVASLSPDDDNFHPYHQTVGLYPKDAAYHNGTVWTWLQGALVSELCSFGRPDIAYRLTENAGRQILDRGAVGTQSELLDALPRPGATEPDLSGTFSQAWNLAEYLRNFSDDYLGARVTLLDSLFTIAPRIPAELGEIHSRLYLGGTAIEVVAANDRVRFILPRAVPELQATVRLRMPDGGSVSGTFLAQPGSTYRADCRGGAFRLTRDGKESRLSSPAVTLPEETLLAGEINFLKPVLREGLRSLRGPAYPLLSHGQITSRNPSANIFIDAEDPPADDTGSGGYAYMRNPSFVPGSFDLLHFTVTTDSLNAYFRLKFRALSDPGWHPEYGFQLTFVAIAVDEDGSAGSGACRVPRNANVTLDSSRAYERLILVGGGVQIEDAKGSILAAYIPAPGDVSDPLGSAKSGTIAFALPLKLLGKPDRRWTMTVMSGGQDDHGGAGIGEFRAVAREAGEWNGGGRKSESDPNVYDTLVARPR